MKVTSGQIVNANIRQASPTIFLVGIRKNDRKLPKQTHSYLLKLEATFKGILSKTMTAFDDIIEGRCDIEHRVVIIGLPNGGG